MQAVEHFHFLPRYALFSTSPPFLNLNYNNKLSMTHRATLKGNTPEWNKLELSFNVVFIWKTNQHLIHDHFKMKFLTAHMAVTSNAQ